MSILNARRIRDYPRLMLVTTWLIMGVNILLHQGWIGAFGQVIAGDFIMFYSTGEIYRANPSMIYDYQTQSQTQQALVSPSQLPGYNPYMNPPFVAPFFSILTSLSLQLSLLVWTLIAVLAVVLSSYLLINLIPANIKIPGFTFSQLVIIVLSFFPFIEGLIAGQNHWLTLLLTTGIVFFMVKDKWYLSGMLAGFLIYKPQFILGFLILWLIWGKFKALISFGVVAACWVGAFALINGINLYQTYLRLSQVFLELPYIPGFPNYLLVTFYGLFTSFLPQTFQPYIYFISQFLLVVSAGGLAWLAYKLRRERIYDQTPAIVAALLLPLIATPYALLHDLVILIPAFVLWAVFSYSRSFIKISAVVYLGAFFLTLVAALTKIAWVALLTMGLFISMAVWAYSWRKPIAEVNLIQ